MCGAKRSAGHSKPVMHYTGYNHRENNAEPCTHQTFTQPTAAQAQRTAGNRTATVLNGHTVRGRAAGSRAALWIALLAVVLAAVPALFSIARQSISMLGGAAHSDVPSDDYQVIPETGGAIEDDGFILYPMLQGAWVAERADGTSFRISIDEDNRYTLDYTETAYQYSETGQVWLWRNDPADEFYFTEKYSYPEFNSYTLNVERDEITYSNGQLPAALSQARARDIWLLLFEQREPADGSAYILVDIDGQGAPLFTQQAMDLHRVQGT